MSLFATASCSSPATPTPPPATPPDPPRITCPAPQTVPSTTGSALSVVYGAPTAVNGAPPVETSCTPASGSQFAVGQTSVSCTATDTLQRTDTCSFVVTVTPPPKLSAVSFLAFGDSLTWGEDGLATSATARFHAAVRLSASQTYPGRLHEQLATRYQTQTPTVDNAGYPGEAAADAQTFPRFVSYTQSGRYQVVLVMEGTNDLAEHDSLVIERAIDALRRMLRDAKARGVRPFLATIPPMNPAGSRGGAYSFFLVDAFNDSVRALAVNEGVTLVDVHRAFANNFTLLSSDGLHPNASGYAVIADTFFAAIKATLEAPQGSVLVPAALGSLLPRLR